MTTYQTMGDDNSFMNQTIDMIGHMDWLKVKMPGGKIPNAIRFNL